MPHAALKLVPGADQIKTQSLAEGAYFQTNLVRFLADRSGLGLAQKLGGWVKYYPNPITSPVRALWAWADLNASNWLAVGAESNLSVINNGNQKTITPTSTTTDFAPSISTTVGSSVITVTNTASNLNTNSYVYFNTPVSAGGIYISGLYAVTTGGSNTYQIDTGTNAAFSSSQTATISIASPAVITVTNAPPTGTVVKFSTTGALPTGITAGTSYFVLNSGSSATQFNITSTIGGSAINTSGTQSGVQTATFPGQVPYFITSASQPTIEVIMPYSDAFVNQGITVTPGATVGGITLSGAYSVSSVTNINQYAFIAANIASTTDAAFQNSGNIDVTYYYAGVPQPPDTGYGILGYGKNGYGGTGYATSQPGTAITTTDWTLNNFGQFLIACPENGAIYYWQPNNYITTAQIVPNGPIVNYGAFVSMPQRQIMAWGSSFNNVIDPLLVRWCDVEDFTVWTASTTNQAGSFRLSEGSKIVAALQGPQQAIFWTDKSVWVAQYVGLPYVYSFNKVASGVGAISRKSVGVLDNVIYWMSPSQFNILGPSGHDDIFCPVWDVVFQNINQNQYSKIRCATNSLFSEVTWYYPSINSTENDSYVTYNAQLKQWTFGSLGRSAWIDQSVLGSPLGSGTGSNAYIYQHEIGNDADGQAMACSFQTGFMELAEADYLTFVDQIWPDMKFGNYNGVQNANVNLTFFATNYPGDTPTQYGPYTFTKATEYISTRIRARLIAVQISSNDVGTFWRLGDIRYRYQPDGKF